MCTSFLQQDAVSQLVLGTEDKRVLILNADGTAVEKSVSLPAVPALLATTGELDVGYRITIAARDGRLYNIKSGSISRTIIQLDSQPVGLVSAIGTRVIAVFVAILCSARTVNACNMHGLR